MCCVRCAWATLTSHRHDLTIPKCPSGDRLKLLESTVTPLVLRGRRRMIRTKHSTQHNEGTRKMITTTMGKISESRSAARAANVVAVANDEPGDHDDLSQNAGSHSSSSIIPQHDDTRERDFWSLGQTTENAQAAQRTTR